MTALLGMGIKYYSGSLAIMFRGTDSDGHMQEVPCSISPKEWGNGQSPWLSFSVFAACSDFGGFTANQFTEAFMGVVEPHETIWATSEYNWKLGIGFLGDNYIHCNFGGLTKIAKVASAIVPFMVGIYLLAVIL